MDELLEQFLIEGRELLQQASDDLLALERDPTDQARIDSAFRAIHTLKGSVGLFDFAPMQSVLHSAEDTLGGIRAGRSIADRPVIDALLDCIGVNEGWIDAIAGAGRLPADAERECRRLMAALTGSAADSVGIAEAGAAAWLPALLARHPDLAGKAGSAGAQLVAFRYAPPPDCFFMGGDPLAVVRAVPGLAALHVEEAGPWSIDAFDPFTCRLIFAGLSLATLDDVRRAFRLEGDQVALIRVETALETALQAGGLADPSADAGSLRIDVARIDALVDLVGELIVAKNRLAHLAAEAEQHAPVLAAALKSNQADIDRLAGGMHQAVTNARMQRLERTFRRFPRLVREIAGQLGKEVVFEVAGGNIEADKTIVDGVFEPLLHLLRNAVDHGIEGAAQRSAADKAPAGLIQLRAEATTGQVVITIADDGAGIDLAKVRETAKAKQLMADAALESLTDQALVDLIFTPGFSTAGKITSLSGRGVGLDVVKTAVERLGGRVEATSHPGAGSKMRLILPQSFALTTVIIVRIGNERYGVPLDTVRETARVPVDRILPFQEKSAFVLRDKTLPLLQLAQLLDRPSAARSAADAKVLVVAAGDQTLGVEVDGFGERIEVMLRPMTGLLAGLSGLLGTSLMGDGRVLMVLDLPGLIK